MCSLEVRLDGDGAIASMRGHEADPLSRGHICPKAFALQDVHEDPDRLRRPVRRTADGGWREVSWDEAIAFAASRLVAVQREHGDDAVAVYQGNPNVHSLGALTHNPTLVRLLRTRNRFSATSVDQLPHQVVAWALYGHQFLLPVPDIDRTDLLVLVGHNPMASNGSLWTVPDFPQRRRELASRGGRLVVIDPRRTETAKVADEHHFVRPGFRRGRAAGGRARAAGRRRRRPRGLRRRGRRGARGGRGASRPSSPSRSAACPRMPCAASRATSPPRRRPPCTGGWASRRRPTAWCASGPCRRSTCSPATSTGPAARCSPRLRSTSSVAGVLGPGGFGKRRSRVRGLPSFAGELPVSALEEEITTPGEGQVRGAADHRGKPGVVHAVGAPARRGAGRPRRHGVDRLLRQRDHPPRRRHPAADRSARARPLRPDLPPPRGARHGPLVAGTLRARAGCPARLGDRPRPRRRAAARAVRPGCATGGRRDALQTEARLRLSPRRQLDALLRSSGARLSVAKLEEMAAGADRGPLKPRLPERLATPDHRIDLAMPLVLESLPGLLAELSAGTGPR